MRRMDLSSEPGSQLEALMDDFCSNVCFYNARDVGRINTGTGSDVLPCVTLTDTGVGVILETCKHPQLPAGGEAGISHL